MHVDGYARSELRSDAWGELVRFVEVERIAREEKLEGEKKMVAKQVDCGEERS